MLRRSLLLVPVAALVLLSTEVRGQFLGRTTEGSNQQAAGATLPSDFRGRITYQGNFSGRRSEPGRAPRRLDLRSIANSSGQTRDFAGPTTIEVEYEGNIVRATYVADGVRSGFTGTRSGTSCRVIDTRDGGVGTLQCDRNSLSGTFVSAPGARATYRTTVETYATRSVDTGEEERRREIAAEAARQRARIAAATRAENDRIAYGNGPLARRMDAIAEIDSRSWFFFAYSPGTMANVHREEVRDARNFTAVGNFRYGDGRTGSLRARIRDGAFSCLKFGNEPQCRPIGQPPSHDFMTGLLLSIVEDAVRPRDR